MYILTILAAVILRVYLLIRDSFPFAYDMGRDLLWTKDIAFYHTPTLIGPAASIWGVYFGPFWYYFLSLPLFITKGNPLSAVASSLSAIVITGVLSYLLFKNILGKTLAFLLLIFILFNSTFINISTFAFHANLLPLLTVLMIYFAYLATVKNPFYIALAFLCTGLMFSADPAPAVVFSTIPLFVYFKFKLFKKGKILKIVAFSFILYLLPFIPQILFEFRNNFVESKALLAYFSGHNPSLSGSLPLVQRIPNRIQIYFDLFKTAFLQIHPAIGVLLSIALVFGIFKFKTQNQNLRKLFEINIYGLVLSFLIYTFVTNVEVKNWYLHGVIVFYAFLLIFALYPIRKYKKTLAFIAVIFVLFNSLTFFKLQRIEQSQTDPATFRNQMEVIDTIYGDNPEKYSVYVFTPSIYDHNYQYIFWWQGIMLKRNLPSDFAYLPNVPPYVRNKIKYQQTAQTQNTIYLIIENAKENEFYSKVNWLSNFKDYKVVWTKNISNAIFLEKRIK